MSPNPSASLTPRVLARFILGGLLVSIVPLLVSGRFDWGEGWFYAGAGLFSGLGSRYLAFRKFPDLLAERASFTGAEGVKAWDKRLMPLISIFLPVLTLVLAGLDKRFQWSPDLPAMSFPAGVWLFLAGSLITAWAMQTNRFFSSVVRIQTERNHTVVSTGPYRYVRHPGYSGAILIWIGTVLVLGTVTAFVPVAFIILFTVLRTALEDKVLQAELPGYAGYSTQTRYRLVPGLW